MLKNKDIVKESDVTSTDDIVKNDVRENAIMRMNRRTFVKMAGAAAGTLALGGGLSQLIPKAQAVPPAPAPALIMYVDPLPIPPVAVPVGPNSYAIPVVKATTHQFHRDLPAAPTYSYGADYLGPTIIAQQGVPISVNFTNKLPLGPHLFNNAIDTTLMGNLGGVNANGAPWADENRVCVHLHGGKVSTAFDGGPRDWFSPEGSDQANPYPDAATTGLMDNYTYQYPNDQHAAFLWYHDHAWGITRFNPCAGLAGAYIIRDAGENALIASGAIPGGNFEVPIVLQDRLLDPLTGAMIYPVAAIPGSVHPLWIPEYFGNIPVVNGKAFPFFEVEPRRYRLKLLNGSNARFYNLWFEGTKGKLPFHVIGSEQGFLPAPVAVNELLLAPGERYEIIADFTGLAVGTNLILKNNAKAPYPRGAATLDQIMQFRVKALTGIDNTTPANLLTLPATPPAPVPPIKSPTTWKEIVLQEVMDPVTGLPMEVLLDGVHFVDTLGNTPLITETNGATSVWQFVNTTADAHPMHPHLVPFKVLDRQKFNKGKFLTAWNAWLLAGRVGPRPSVDAYLQGKPIVPAPEETGWKDTAKSYPGEVLRIVATFNKAIGQGTVPARYVCHCHILEHEENDMMFQFEVV